MVKYRLLLELARSGKNQAVVEKNADPDKAAHAIGARLKLALEVAGKTNAWLAEELGVSDQAVGQWLRTGKIARDRIPRIAELLGVSTDWLLAGMGSMPRPKPEHQALAAMYERMSADNKRVWEATGHALAQSPRTFEPTGNH